MPETVLEPITGLTPEPSPDLILSETYAQPQTQPGGSSEIPLNPARKDHLTRITPDKARLMAQRSAKARAERARNKLNPTPQPALEPAPKPANNTAELALVQEQITRITEQLRDPMEPNERAQLVRALDLMLDRKRVLMGIPGPGSLRPTDKPSQGRASLLLGSQAESGGRGSVEQE